MSEPFRVITDSQEFSVTGVGVLSPGRDNEVVALFYMNAPSGDRRLLIGTQLPDAARADSPTQFMFIPPETPALARYAMSPDNPLVEFASDRIGTQGLVGAISLVKKIKDLRPENW